MMEGHVLILDQTGKKDAQSLVLSLGPHRCLDFLPRTTVCAINTSQRWSWVGARLGAGCFRETWDFRVFICKCEVEISSPAPSGLYVVTIFPSLKRET